MPLKPWTLIWFKPRKAVHTILGVDHIPMSLLIIKGLVFNLNFSIGQSFGNQYSLFSIIGLSLLLSIISGAILVRLWGWVLMWIGKILGGVGSVDDITKLYTWSAVFDCVSLVLYSILIARMGKWFFHVNAGELMTAFDFGVSLLGTIVYFWSLAYLVVAVSEIHAFSKWKGFFTLAIVIIPLALLGLS